MGRGDAFCPLLWRCLVGRFWVPFWAELCPKGGSPTYVLGHRVEKEEKTEGETENETRNKIELRFKFDHNMENTMETY